MKRFCAIAVRIHLKFKIFKKRLVFRLVNRILTRVAESTIVLIGTDVISAVDCRDNVLKYETHI